MSNILAVFGATGHQGESIINYVLNDPELSQKFKIRAITRNADSEKAKQLKEKVQVVEADILDRASLETALTGAHTVFAMTVPDFGPDGFQTEYNSGKVIADVAVEKGVEYIIFSTLPSVKELSGGKYTKSDHFEAKAQVERYIRGLPIQSAFYSPGSFMSNFHDYPFFVPHQAPDGTWVLTGINAPTAQIPWVDIIGDTGTFVGAILAEPDKYQGETFCAATALYSWEEITATMSKVTGKPVVYRQVSAEEFKKNVPFDAVIDGISCGEEFGYWGPDSKNLIAWASENARGKLSTLEDYLEARPLQLA